MELNLLISLIKNLRLKFKLSQKKLAEEIGIVVSVVNKFEKGLEVENDDFKKICNYFNLPKELYINYINSNQQRLQFESILSELTGKKSILTFLSPIEIEEANNHINKFFQNNIPLQQSFDNFNRCLIFYGIKKTSIKFFSHYLCKNITNFTIKNFENNVTKYQKDIMRTYNTFSLAYEELNQNDEIFDKYLDCLKPISVNHYNERTEWNSIIEIDNKLLKYLGYIAAAEAKKDDLERKEVNDFLEEIINNDKIPDTPVINRNLLEIYFNKPFLHKIDSLLRKIDKELGHSLFSSLFSVSKNDLKELQTKIKPFAENEILIMQKTQNQALSNLTNYLTADYMDFYVATSMRTEGDFISVNKFIKRLIHHKNIKDLKLRYFNPTLSWIEDRVSKGLVEALMLKRANVTVYMAQKTDTFGKDSEASVSLGQGKPVIVYVPKLVINELDLDTEKLGNNSLEELQDIYGNSDSVGLDKQSLLSNIIEKSLEKATNEILITTLKKYWDKFDLESESYRIKDDVIKKDFKTLINLLKSEEKILQINEDLAIAIREILLATSINFEKRAHVFKEIHPLALQVVITSGVLNGILVTRTLNSTANLLSQLLENKLEYELEKDVNNYKLLEKTTKSVVRVISKNQLLINSFEQFYK
ncbi:MAG: helix-turn-helix domain-containing protein [Arcobacter sp.]|uniref:helix-turn-helix domain-containing protein n=1 Tax=Arcobacter sp. TaxID=1872629 RepID=UPI003CFC859B